MNYCFGYITCYSLEKGMKGFYMITNVTKDNFTSEIEQSTQSVVVDVYASWCGPCQQMMPVFEEIAKELSSKYKFAKLNIDENREIATKFNVSSVPTFLFVKNGKLVGKEMGYMNKDILKQKIEDLLG